MDVLILEELARLGSCLASEGLLGWRHGFSGTGSCERCLSCASFLGGECHVLCFFHFDCLDELLYIILLD